MGLESIRLWNWILKFLTRKKKRESVKDLVCHQPLLFLNSGSLMDITIPLIESITNKFAAESMPRVHAKMDLQDL